MWRINLTVQPPNELLTSISVLPIATIQTTFTGAAAPVLSTEYILPEGLGLTIADPYESDVLAVWVLTKVSVNEIGAVLWGYLRGNGKGSGETTAINVYLVKSLT